eukprot:1139077-Pelagomonas_calceolata.AAC.22
MELANPMRGCRVLMLICRPLDAPSLFLVQSNFMAFLLGVQRYAGHTLCKAQRHAYLMFISVRHALFLHFLRNNP